MESPLVLEPCLEVGHIDTVVVAKTGVGVANSIIIVCCNVITTYIGNICLREAAIRSQLFDITVSKSININPLTSAEQIVDGLIVDTLRIASLYTQRHL